jgi:lipopolysaccharide transport system ATP-binding protein
MGLPRSILGRATKRSSRGNEFWALRDVSFEIKRGEILGLIGSNGAGKSTLLKILSRITYPTSGHAEIRGTVGSLLEVGTGFSPELTGRENIFLNGSILGMSRREIRNKFDDIVDFAEVHKFIDTPVKHYSSGMYMRLAFSVAAHLEPDILLVDEVLAVGDVEFQNKCLGKMDEITKKHGRTIIFVSHNMGAIQQLCSKTVLLKNGLVEKIGKTEEILSYYLKKQATKSLINFKSDSKKVGQISSVGFVTKDGKYGNYLSVDEDFTINVQYKIRKTVRRVTFCVEIFSRGELVVLSSETERTGKLQTINPGTYLTKVKIPAYFLNAGSYYLKVSIQRPGIEYVDKVENVAFEVRSTNNPKFTIFGGQLPGISAALLNYETTKKQ